MDKQTKLAIDLGQIIYTNTINSLTEQRDRAVKALEFAEYMAKKAEEYIEEYNLLEEERLAQSFNGNKDSEKLFQMEQDLGEIATQLKIYIHEFRKRKDAR